MYYSVALERFCTMIVAIVGGVLVALGSGTAAIAPAAQLTPADGYPSYPFGDSGISEQQDKRLEKALGKAEKLGSSATSKIIDFGASILKCVLNITSPSVKCDL
ncbi:hypothetical protein AB0M12_16025 [Nocardia vinacea]|uniref:hypothetical protein n=1 Tax=Nocardia vinacea TaxID=96468 RepID=UPI00342007CB